MKAAYPEISRAGGAEDQGQSGQDVPNLPTAPASTQPRRDPRNGKIKWFKFWTVEVRGRTSTLAPAAFGAYVRLLAHYLDTQSPLPDDAKLARIAGLRMHEWPAVRDELLDVFDLVDGHLHDDYAERCIAEFRNRSKIGAANVRARYQTVNGGLEDAS